MTEQLISFETAKLAKKGFDVECSYALATNYFQTKNVNTAIVTEELKNYYDDYVDEGENIRHNFKALTSYKNNKHQPQIVARPTQSLLQKWIREIHNINIEVSACASGYRYKLCKANKDCTSGTFISDSDWNETNDGGCWDIYKEALESVLKDALFQIKPIKE